MIIPITDGDIMHIYGGFGTGIDYSVRLSLRLIDTVNGEMLKEAVQNTQNRYPYLLLRLKKDEEKLYYEAPDLDRPQESFLAGSPPAGYGQSHSSRL